MTRFDIEKLEDIISEMQAPQTNSLSRQLIHNWRKGKSEPTFSKLATFLDEAGKIVGRKLKFEHFIKKV